jgi:predicted transcriptional regulator
MSNTFIEANRKGHTYIDNAYMYDERLIPTEKTVYAIICSACYADKDFTTVGQITLSKAVNRSVRSIQRAVKKLKQLGYILVKRRGSISNKMIVLAKQIRQVREKASKSVKKAYNSFKQQSKGNTKASSWNTDSNRNYNWSKLEEALINKKGCSFEELLE